MFPSVLTSDYLFPSALLTFPAGSTNGSTMPLSFTIVDDMALEGSHSFFVDIASVETPSGPESLLTIGSPSSSEVIIEDDERTFVHLAYTYYSSNLTSFSTTGVTLGFVQPETNIFENQSLFEVCISISDIPTGGLECDVEAIVGFGGDAKTS